MPGTGVHPSGCNGMLCSRQVPPPPGARSPGFGWNYDPPPLSSPWNPALSLRARSLSRGAAVLRRDRGSAVIGGRRASRARPLAVGGVHVKGGGLGRRPEWGEVARKLKGAARRLEARVPGEGPQGGGGWAALAHGRMRPPAEGAHLSPGRCACCRRRCPCHPGAGAAAGWRLRTSGLMSCTRYVPHQARKARCPAAGKATSARVRDPLWFLPHTLSQASLQLHSGHGTL